MLHPKNSKLWKNLLTYPYHIGRPFYVFLFFFDPPFPLTFSEKSNKNLNIEANLFYLIFFKLVLLWKEASADSPSLSLQTRNKLQKSIKGVLNCCKLQVILKVKIKSVITLVLETLFRKFLHQVWFISFSVDYAMNPGTCIRHLVVRSGEHIGISSLTNKRVQRKKDSAVCHHLLNCNYSPTFEDSSVLCHVNKKYLLKLKKSLLIMRDTPSMNQNVRSARLYLFE